MSGIDLSQLPAPAVVEPLDFETILSAMVQSLRDMVPNEFAHLSESDPAYKVLQVCAYREMIVRQRVNEASKAVMLAYAARSDLDHLAALFGVKRLLIATGDPQAVPPRDAVYESDDDLRKRTQLSIDGFSVAGPEGAYRFHALSASGQVADAWPTSPSPGVVVVSVLGRDGDGTASEALLATVRAAVSAESVRPLTDDVHVQSAAIKCYQIRATLYCYQGPDSTVVVDAARSAAQRYADNQRRIGRSITRSGIYAALHQPGVQRVLLHDPEALAGGQEEITIDKASAAYCEAIEIQYGGVDE